MKYSAHYGALQCSDLHTPIFSRAWFIVIGPPGVGWITALNVDQRTKHEAGR